MSKREIRSNITEIQAEGSTLTGYIARFNSLSADLGGFSEKITPGCFASSISSTAPIRALVNHNTDHCIGNTASGTLQLHEDDKGLSFSCELPDTQAARDLKVSVTRGDVTGASFGFVTKSTRGLPTKRVGTSVLLTMLSCLRFPPDALSPRMNPLRCNCVPFSPMVQSLSRRLAAIHPQLQMKSPATPTVSAIVNSAKLMLAAFAAMKIATTQTVTAKT